MVADGLRLIHCDGGPRHPGGADIGYPFRPSRISEPAPMMTNLRDVLLKLSRREDLTRDDAREAFELIMSGQASEAQIGGLLVGSASKGTTAEELIGAATVMREKAVAVACSAEDGVIVDTCGT